MFDGFVKIFNKESITLVDKLEAKFKNKNIPTNALPNVTSATLEIIFRKIYFH